MNGNDLDKFEVYEHPLSGTSSLLALVEVDYLSRLSDDDDDDDDDVRWNRILCPSMTYTRLVVQYILYFTLCFGGSGK
jgi:hypothetical protein